MEETNTTIEFLKLIIEGIQVLAWPILTVILVLMYNRPLRKMLDSLSSKFSEASKVSIGSLSLEVQAKAREAGNPKLAREVGTLSPPAIEQLLRTPRVGDMILLSTSDYQGNRNYGLPKLDEMNALRELEQKGFIKFREKLEPFLDKLHALRNTSIPNSDRVWFAASGPVASSTDEKFRKQGYTLTDLGHQAVDAIVKAVAAQLAQK